MPPAHGGTGARNHWRVRRPKQALRLRTKETTSRKRKLGDVGLMCSRVASRPKVIPKPKETLRHGRPTGAKELTLFEQTLFVDAALEEKFIEWNERRTIY